MEGKELMIGDFVGIKCAERGTFNIKVTSINERLVVGVRVPDYKFLRGYYTDLSPIPLTKETLEKNGFVCTQKADESEEQYECWSFNDGLLSITFEPDGVMLEVHNGCDNGSAVRTVNYYTDNDYICVHELQNLMTICRIEKEIEI